MAEYDQYQVLAIRPPRGYGRPGKVPSERSRRALVAVSRSTGVGMARFPKPPEGSWTQHYPKLGTEPVSYEDSITPESFELEQQAIFKRAWLNVGRVEQLPRKGSYFTKELKAVNTS